jgi:hypothetical protein
LHRKGWSSPTAITSQADAENQAASRGAEQMNSYVNFIRQSVDLTPAQEAEVRNNVTNPESYDWAVRQKEQCIKDRGFYRRLLDGGMAERAHWARVNAILAMRVVRR